MKRILKRQRTTRERMEDYIEKLLVISTWDKVAEEKLKTLMLGESLDNLSEIELLKIINE